MSSSTMNPNLSNSHLDQQQWVIFLRKQLCEEIEEENEEIHHVCIFSVPKSLMERDPECYVPQQVAIGPYHYWRSHEMERYKLCSAKRMQQNLKGINFEDVVHHLMKCELQVRSCYHKYLTFNSETLAWIMAVDSCFLLEFLQIYDSKQDTTPFPNISSRMLHLVGVARRNSTHNAILKDIVMLENQVPLFVPRKMLEFQYSSLEMANEKLLSMLVGLIYEIYPFHISKEIVHHHGVEIKECKHLLDFLYHFVVPKMIQPRQSEMSDLGELIGGNESETTQVLRSSNHLKQLLNEAWTIIISKLNKGPLESFNKFVTVLVKLPWREASKFPGVKFLKRPIEFFCMDQEKEESPGDIEDSSITNNKPPLVEELAIPSVSELVRAGVVFLPTREGISSIKFDAKSCRFHLPSISLDFDSEVLFKNLVAYEACNARGPVIFTRYTELMNGIIDTKEDARILRECGIVLNRLKSDEDVMKLWNGMDRSVRLTKAPILDKVIEDVNKFYNGRWNVKARKMLKAYVYSSWQCLTLVACVLLLFFTILEAFCSVYNCKQIFKLD